METNQTSTSQHGTNQTSTSENGRKSNIYKSTLKHIKHFQVNMETNQTSTSHHGNKSNIYKLK